MKKRATLSLLLLMGISVPLKNDQWKKFAYRGPALYNGADDQRIIEEKEVKSEEQIKREEMALLTIEELKKRHAVQEDFLKTLAVEVPKDNFDDCTKEELINLIVENAKLIEEKSKPILENAKQEMAKEETKQVDVVKEETIKEQKEETKKPEEEDRYAKLEEEIKMLKNSNKDLKEKICRKDASQPLDFNTGFLMLQSQINNIQLMQQNMLMLQMFNVQFSRGSDYLYQMNPYINPMSNDIKLMFNELGQRTPSVYDYFQNFNQMYPQSSPMPITIAPENNPVVSNNQFNDSLNSFEYFANPYYFDQVHFN